MTSTIPNVAGIAFICWLAGVAFFVRRGMMAWRTARRLRAGSELLNDLTLRTMVDELRGRFGLVRSPELRRCSELDAPALTGVFRPAILLPAKLITSGEAELKLMLAHELAHQKRGDLAWNWLLWTGQTLFWFHPVVWLAAREWRLAQEVACDAMAVRETHSPVATYGAMLLKIVLSGRSACPENLFAVGVGERYATLHRRLSAMKYFSGMAESRYALLVCAAVATGIVVPWHVTTLPALAQTSPSSVLDSKSEGAGARASPTAAAPLPDAQLLASRSANNGQAVAGALVHDPTRQTLHALSGSGVVITLSDKPIKSKMTSPFIPGIVHDFDIRRIVNELQAANAEGIAINGVRMTNSTAIRCIGPNIHIGQQVVQHPYRVEAIGDPQALVGALSKKGGVLTSLKPWEHNIRVARANHLRLPTRPVP
jgi:beta-lactamase regulating signal transducer with metallopeptidase domain